MLKKSSVTFLRDLKINNNREWFEINRDRYEEAYADFTKQVSLVIDSFGKIDPTIGLLNAKECRYRIYRDIRFSNDKTPYKTHFGASFCEGGRHSSLAGYYISFEPDGSSFIGAGYWHPDSKALRVIRQEIDYCFGEFKQILKHPNFINHFKTLDVEPNYVLKKAPKGYDENSPAIEFLKMKTWTISKHIPDSMLVSEELDKLILDVFKAASPFVHFLNEPLKELLDEDYTFIE